MNKKNIGPIVPKQRTGRAIDAKGSLTLKDENEAKSVFAIAKNRLQNVNEWADVAGNLSATFQLVNADGIEVQRSLQQGDYFKIDIPGPGPKTGDGFDWVQIEDVEDKSSSDFESFSFRVRPSQNPQNKSEDIAHFYSRDSTSTFTISRKGCNIESAIRDRNTKPNKSVHRPLDKIRDAIVGTAGLLTFSKIQWENLIDGLLSR